MIKFEENFKRKQKQYLNLVLLGATDKKDIEDHTDYTPIKMIEDEKYGNKKRQRGMVFTNLFQNYLKLLIQNEQ